VKLSIVVPVLNDAAALSTLLQLPRSSDIEWIVVDGGSQDRTIAIAKATAVTLLSSPPGRAVQMNTGAAIATGDILLFLHSDTQLPDNFETLIYQTLAPANVIAGAFELKIDTRLLGIRLIEWGVNARSRLLQMPYGDQAIFLKRTVFEEIGGFPEMPIMEDFELIRRLKQHGKIAIAPAPVVTAGRRWQKLGVVRTTLINQCIILGYAWGISPDRLKTWYRKL
jgi:rSAM/selenodomain-associated transferase 2